VDPIYDMNLHDELTVGDWLILRVAHGWIYSRLMGANVVSSSFVPDTLGVDRSAE